LKFSGIFGCLGAEAEVHADTVRILCEIVKESKERQNGCS
jgi:hypothetical protein